MERLHFVEIELMRATSTLKRAERHKQAIWMVTPLKVYIRQLEQEKAYYYERMMKQRMY